MCCANVKCRLEGLFVERLAISWWKGHLLLDVNRVAHFVSTVKWILHSPVCSPIQLQIVIACYTLNTRQTQDIRCWYQKFVVRSSWNVMAHGDAREGKWMANWRMAWVASTLHSTSEHGVSNITTADAHTSAASSRLNWRPRRFKWARPFRRKTKSGLCACAITFQKQSTSSLSD
jgi:hypothetical protein